MYQSPTLCHVAVTLHDLVQEKIRQTYCICCCTKIAKLNFWGTNWACQLFKTTPFEFNESCIYLRQKKKAKPDVQNNCNEKKRVLAIM